MDLQKFLARQSASHVKDLPSFSGAPEEWLLCYAQFKSSAKFYGYSDEENINRLLRSLRGEARESVYALLLNAYNLSTIIDTLKLRFGRPDLIIDAMTSKIKTMRDIRHDDVSQLLKYATDVQSCLMNNFTTFETKF